MCSEPNCIPGIMAYKSGRSRGQNREESLSESRQKAADPLYILESTDSRKRSFYPSRGRGRDKDGRERSLQKVRRQGGKASPAQNQSLVRYLDLKEAAINMWLLKS